jgi:predicted amidohydrolase YtcJ
VILQNGVIRTLDPALPTAGALAIAGDRIAGGVGVHETALASPEVVNLGGRCVVPGFTDSHVHYPTWALAQREVKLEDTRTFEEALARIAGAARPVAPGGWLRGRGWRAGDWDPPTEPTRQALDAVTGDVPAAFLARDSHSIWVNSAALDRAKGVNLTVAGGVVELDDRGEPTGVLREESAWHFRDAVIHISDDEHVSAMRDGLKLCAARGVTSVHDKDGWIGSPRLWQRLRRESGLTLRVWQSLPAELADRLRDVHLETGYGDDFHRFGYLKAFMDGALGSGTALMADGSGVRITSRDELIEIVRAGIRARIPVGVHAIGDQANRDALDAFEATKDEWAPLGLRHRIEHAQILLPGDAERFARIGVAVSCQFSHAPSDRDLAERAWPGETHRAYAWRTLLDAGAFVCNGSDAPIEELDPLAGIVAGVLRTVDDRPAWHPEQAVTVEEAFAATCVNPPWLAGDERRRGKLLPGYLADLVVLDRDPFAIEPEELPEVQVVATMVGGRWVHGAPPWD